VGVIAAIAVPRYANALGRFQIDAAAQRVVVDIQRAQSHAKATSRSVTVVFNPLTHQITIPSLPSLTQPDLPHVTELGQEPYRTRLNNASFADNARLDFDGYGQPAVGGSVTLRTNRHTRVITVDPDTGEATIQ